MEPIKPQRAPFIFGVVEGFYGVFYTMPERIDLIRFLGKHGYNQYLYAPKNDRQHRLRWWEPYPAQVMAGFGEAAMIAGGHGVRFCYGISPGQSICYSDPADFERLTAKLRGFFDLGVRDFSLMLDDNEPGFRHSADAECYASLVDAQADLANRLYGWLQSQDRGCTLSFCPAEYYGPPPFNAALTTLGAALRPEIDVCYTGREICSPRISAEDARAFGEAVRRAPIIWDNYPVNDLAMNPELHLGPITGRAADLPGAVHGFLINPMLQAEASKIPLATYAAYIADPAGYDPQAAWEQALVEVAGEAYAAPLQRLAENTETSCLGCRGETLDCLAGAALEALRSGQLDSAPVNALESYLAEIDESTYTLKFRMENLSLRGNLLPWCEILEHWMWITRFALKALHAVASGQDYFGILNRVHEYRELIRSHPKRIATQALLPLVEYALEQAVQDQHRRAQGTREQEFVGGTK